MIAENYVSFETAKLLKEKGFNGSVSVHYNELGSTIMSSNPISKNCIKCPTIQMAMKWLREVHNRYVEICMDKAHNFKDIVFRPAIYDKSLDCLWESDNFPTYEEACEKAIKYCLENLI